MAVSGRCGSRQIKFFKHAHPPDTTQTHTGNALWDWRVREEFRGTLWQIPQQPCCGRQKWTCCRCSVDAMCVIALHHPVRRQISNDGFEMYAAETILFLRSGCADTCVETCVCSGQLLLLIRRSAIVGNVHGFVLISSSETARSFLMFSGWRSASDLGPRRPNQLLAMIAQRSRTSALRFFLF